MIHACIDCVNFDCSDAGEQKHADCDHFLQSEEADDEATTQPHVFPSNSGDLLPFCEVYKLLDALFQSSYGDCDVCQFTYTDHETGAGWCRICDEELSPALCPVIAER